MTNIPNGNREDISMVIDTAVMEDRARRAVAELSRYVTVVGAFLFGSHVDGRADEWSDIDIGVFVEGLGQWDLMEEIRTSCRIQKEVGNDIELHFFPAHALTNPEPASFANYVIRHGRPIAFDNSSDSKIRTNRY